jgi:alpha-N-arabinofuranosidase
MIVMQGCDSGGSIEADTGHDGGDGGRHDAGQSDGGISCEDAGACPKGFHCVADAGRCATGCGLDTDCDPFQKCDTKTGECVTREAAVTVVVSPETVVKAVKPVMGGSGIEIENNAQGLCAEMLRDRGFEWDRPYVIEKGIDPWSVRADPDVTAAMEWVSDPLRVWQGKHSVKFSVTKEMNHQYGSLAQAGLALTNGRDYSITFMIYHDGSAPAWVQLAVIDSDSKQMVISPAKINIDPLKTNKWVEYTATFRPDINSDNAILMLQVANRSWFWIDAVSVRPKNALSSWWPEVEEAFKGGVVALLRLGGTSADGYDWRGGVGPKDKRAMSVPALAGTTLDPEKVLQHTPYYNDFGTHEFLDFCKAIGAEPMLVVNFPLGAQAAANWVEYVNLQSPGKAYGQAQGWTLTSYKVTDKAPPGYFPWVREMYDRQEPWNVKYWEIGERQWDQELPEPGSLRGQENLDSYSNGTAAFAAKMRETDPSISIAVNAAPIPAPPLSDYRSKWNATVLDKAGELVDMLSPQFYAPGDFNPNGSGMTPEKVFYRIAGVGPFFNPQVSVSAEDIAAWKTRSGKSRDLGVAVSEYNIYHGVLNYTDPNSISTLRGVIGAATLRNAVLGGPPVLAGQYNMIGQPFGLVYLTPDPYEGMMLIRTGQYLLNRLYRDTMLASTVKTSVNAPTYTAELWSLSPMTAAVVDAVAMKDAGGNKLKVILVNRNYSAEPLLTELSAAGFDPSGVKVLTLSGASPDVFNSPDTPDAIRLTEETMTAEKGILRFFLKPFSVTVFEMTK